MELRDKLSVEDYQKINLAVGWKLLRDEDVATAIKNSMFVVSAVENGRVVGMARMGGGFWSTRNFD